MTDDRHSEELGTAIRAAVAGVHAPAGLRARVEADRAARRSPRRSRGPALGFAGAAAVGLSAAAIVLVMGLLGGNERREGPTLAGAVSVALRAPVGRPPA